MTGFAEKVFDVVMKIPKGRVTTYGQVAFLCGHKGAARAVGSALHKNPAFGLIPCHRVVNSKGGLAASYVFGGKDVQKRLLAEEGISFSDEYTVDMSKHFWFS
jgi:methylated-DNA-protein-cysteine methyltransferase-like protein